MAGDPRTPARRSRPPADEVERARRLDSDSFGEALGRAIHHRGVSLDWLRIRLVKAGTPVSAATLSYWRSGRRQPERQSSFDAVARIEKLLDVPRGSLVALVGPSRRPGPRRHRIDVAELSPHPALAAQMLAELGLDGDCGLSDSTRHHVVEVDEHGRQTTVAVRKVIMATRDGADRYAVLGATRSPIIAPPDLTARRGCRVGQTAVRRDEQLFVWELVLERPLRLGESALTDHLLTMHADPSPTPMFEISLPERTPEAAVWVNFHPDRMPNAVELYTDFDGSRPTCVLADLDGATSAHILRQRCGPGRMGVRWSW